MKIDVKRGEPENKYAEKWEGTLPALVKAVANSDARWSAYDPKTNATIKLDPNDMDQMLVFYNDEMYEAYDDDHALRILQDIRKGKKNPGD